MIKYIFLILVLASTSLVGANENVLPGFETYLGLAIPYPEQGFLDTISYDKGKAPLDRRVSIMLKIDPAGKVKDLIYHPDSSNYIKPVAKAIKRMRFNFTPGRVINDPLMVPIYLSSRRLFSGQVQVDLSFPVSPEVETDPIMLRELFVANNILPPTIENIPPIFHKVYPEREKCDYLTITARVTLDAGGELINVDFPIPGQDMMTHYVFMSLLKSEFRAPTLNGEPFDAEFLLTFRIFDNIKYPFSPIVRGDTSTSSKITEKYFMTLYYHANDISLPPIPRKYPNGYIRTAKYGKSGLGNAEAYISVDSSGYINRVSVLSASPSLLDLISKTVKLTSWYPAKDNRNQSKEFTGNINFNFVGSTKVLYSPEWLENHE